MRRYSQLTRLIWDFYRENQRELQQLHLLGRCKVFRRWGVLHIRCWDRDLAESVLRRRALIEEPVAKLRLAQKISISVDTNRIALFRIGSDKQIA
ncbi:MAG: hypothetical protein HC910_08605 [Spirulinaceae cyanobacterium SM2_1_0]|nr:hypothetical protein [Spirulinaceae cyanobacterium SM2_1_0]